MSGEPLLVDIADMPNFNPASNTLGLTQRDVSEGRVFYGVRADASKDALPAVSCVEHGAMLCVNPERTIYRCIACNAGAYVAASAPVGDEQADGA